ncbi:MAG: glutathione S-transferase [Labilithrix sp.]|nr:glutathione S-transferase [Labilithrix sp.]MCW5809578.1 glutathione S-transferase [Labilithrix sp.]
MITVHHLEKSRSHRVLWLLEELGVPYEMKTYARDPKTLLAPPVLAEVHPLGKSPVVVDGESTVAESAAILEYLVDRHGEGRLVPKPGTPEHLKYRYWMHYAEGSAMSPLLLKLVFSEIKRKAPWPVKPIAKAIANQVLSTFVDPNLATHFGWVESQLAKSPWFAGEEMTIADIQMSYPVEGSFVRSDLGDRPKTRAWLDRVQARPAYQRALEKGGPMFV